MRKKLCLWTICLFLGGLISLSVGERKYDGYKVIRVTPQTKQQLQLIASFQNVDFWKEPSAVGKSIDIMMSKSASTSILRLLKKYDISPKIILSDVQREIEREKREFYSFKSFSTSSAQFNLSQYHSHVEIGNWLNSLQVKYPDLAKVFSIGKTKEGRNMTVIQIGKRNPGKLSFWIDGGTHAREWVSPATVVYIIDQLLTNYATSKDYQTLLDGVNFFMLPVLNPDGYEYSRSTNRLWRKNRAGPFKKRGWFSKSCYGVDLNRNYDIQWGASGTSTNPCSEEFGGLKANSELETQAVTKFLATSGNMFRAYMTIHSYSDDWFYPYAYAPHIYPSNIKELRKLSEGAVAAIKSVHGTIYEAGSPSDILYAAAGSSMDWAESKGKISWSFGMELRPGPHDPDPDQQYGFLLPAKYIIPTASEAWSGMKSIAEAILVSN